MAICHGVLRNTRKWNKYDIVVSQFVTHICTIHRVVNRSEGNPLLRSQTFLNLYTPQTILHPRNPMPAHYHPVFPLILSQLSVLTLELQCLVCHQVPAERVDCESDGDSHDNSCKYISILNSHVSIMMAYRGGSTPGEFS